jgi:hypothetical protein
MEKEEERSSNMNLSMKVDGSSQNVPVLVGAEVQGGHTKRQKESVGKISDFIFAYRLNEIKYKWSTTSHKPISHGHIASRGDASEQQQQQEKEPEGYDLIGLDPDPFAVKEEIDADLRVVD